MTDQEQPIVSISPIPKLESAFRTYCWAHCGCVEYADFVMTTKKSLIHFCSKHVPKMTDTILCKQYDVCFPIYHCLRDGVCTFCEEKEKQRKAESRRNPEFIDEDGKSKEIPRRREGLKTRNPITKKHFRELEWTSKETKTYQPKNKSY